MLLLFALALGILGDRLGNPSPGVELAAAALCLVAWVVVGYYWQRLASTLLLAAVGLLGAVWHHVWWHCYPANEIGRLAASTPAPCLLEVDLIAEPRRMSMPADSPLNIVPAEPRTLLRCEARQVRDGMRWRPVSGQLEVYVQGVWREGQAGDRLRLVGHCVRVVPPRNPGEFDFLNYFRGQRRLAVAYVDNPLAIEIVRPGRHFGNWLRASLRQRLDQAVWEQVPAEQAGLASAVLLGNRQQLSDEQRDLFMLSSTIHVLSISGLHVGILAQLLYWFLRLGLLPRRWCLAGVIGLVFFYAWLVEFNAPVTRSAVWIGLFCGSRILGQRGAAMNLLACAGLIVLAINPADLFGVGPQLSFLAVASMIGAGPYLRQPADPLDQLIFATRSWPVRFAIWFGQHCWLAFMLSAVIWIVALPIVAARYQILSPIGLLVNPLILLPMALAMYSGMAVLFCGWWFPWLGQFFGWCCYASLNFMVAIVDWATHVPGGYFWVLAPPLSAIGLYYLGVWWCFLLPQTRWPARWLLAGLAGWLAVGWALPVWQQRLALRSPRKDCEITFVDVGHGLSALIQLPDGRSILYDAGSFGGGAFGVRSVAAVLWSKGVEHLDAVVLSHSDLDHINALPELCHRFSMGRVYVSPRVAQQETAALSLIRRELERQQIPIRPIHSGTRFEVGAGCQIECLGPPHFGTGGNDNSDSVVLSLRLGGKRLLLTADLEGPGLQFLLAQPGQDHDVVLAPHHASLHSLPQEFFEWAQPELVIVSGNDRQTESAGAKLFESLGAQVRSTGESGALTVRISPEGIDCRGFRETGSMSNLKSRPP